MDPITATGLIIMFGLGIGGVIAGAAGDAPEDSRVKRVLRKLSLTKRLRIPKQQN
jgi:hypothetical protein